MPRRPCPIALHHCPLDTLWEVDESDDGQMSRTPARTRTRFVSLPASQIRSVFEDDDEDLSNISFPLPPISLPAGVKLTTPRSMSLPIQPVPSSSRSSPSSRPSASSRAKPSAASLYASARRAPPPPASSLPFPRERIPSPPTLTPPRRQRSDAPRPVSPTSSASSSDTEPPPTPPSASIPIPDTRHDKRKPLVAPAPAEWESAIDELFACAYDEPLSQRSYLSYSPVSSPLSLAPPQLPRTSRTNTSHATRHARSTVRAAR